MRQTVYLYRNIEARVWSNCCIGKTINVTDVYNVYWTVHHCNSWRMKEQLDVTCYFISRKFTLKLNHSCLQNKTIDVIIQQHSRKLLIMDILMSETCWTHKKWNKIASDIKSIFHSSPVTDVYWTVHLVIAEE